MAKIKFGAIVTDMRGKVGGQVFSKNKAGAYTRSFKVNVVSSTPAQVTVRNRFATYSTGWRSLTQSQRDSWDLAVNSFKHTNIFGNIINPSGIDLYVGLNFNLNQIGQPSLTVAPLPNVLGFIKNLVVLAESSTPSIKINFDASSITVGYTLVVMATASISAGKNYVKNLVRQIAVISPTVGVPYDMTAAYLAKFTTILSGARISVAVIVVNNATGQKSEPLYATTIVSGGEGLDFTEALDTGIPLT